jgi:hypothetical protein
MPEDILTEESVEDALDEVLEGDNHPGSYDYAVAVDGKTVSIGVERTGNDQNTGVKMGELMYELCEKSSRDIAEEHYFCRDGRRRCKGQITFL